MPVFLRKSKFVKNACFLTMRLFFHNLFFHNLFFLRKFPKSVVKTGSPAVNHIDYTFFFSRNETNSPGTIMIFWKIVLVFIIFMFRPSPRKGYKIYLRVVSKWVHQKTKKCSTAIYLRCCNLERIQRKTKSKL